MKDNFEIMVNKVIKAIQEIEPENTQQMVHQKCIIYVISKLCENEDIFTDNLYLLDKHAENGAEKTYQKKFVRGGGKSE